MALKPLDPDQAPIAAVDRFSEKAAHLQVRTADNKIPGPNEPVDFDTGPFITQGLSPTTALPTRARCSQEPQGGLAMSALEDSSHDQANQDEGKQAEQLECHDICFALGSRAGSHVSL